MSEGLESKKKWILRDENAVHLEMVEQEREEVPLSCLREGERRQQGLQVRECLKLLGCLRPTE